MTHDSGHLMSCGGTDGATNAGAIYLRNYYPPLQVLAVLANEKSFPEEKLPSIGRGLEILLQVLKVIFACKCECWDSLVLF